MLHISPWQKLSRTYFEKNEKHFARCYGIEGAWDGERMQDNIAGHKNYFYSRWLKKIDNNKNLVTESYARCEDGYERGLGSQISHTTIFN